MDFEGEYINTCNHFFSFLSAFLHRRGSVCDRFNQYKKDQEHYIETECKYWNISTMHEQNSTTGLDMVTEYRNKTITDSVQGGFVVSNQTAGTKCE